jgi:hypothetical protein
VTEVETVEVSIGMFPEKRLLLSLSDCELIIAQGTHRAVVPLENIIQVKGYGWREVLGICIEMEMMGKSRYLHFFSLRPSGTQEYVQEQGQPKKWTRAVRAVEAFYEALEARLGSYRCERNTATTGIDSFCEMRNLLWSWKRGTKRRVNKA